MNLEARITTYGSRMRKIYGRKIFKAGISTGIECPHRLQTGGCIFCLPETFTDASLDYLNDPIKQLNHIIPKIKASANIDNRSKENFLAYFHSGTATAGDLNDLKLMFSETLKHKEICGLVLSTRPDYIDEDVLSMLKGLPGDIYLELGVQTIHQKSLDFLKRGHTQEDTDHAVKLCEKYKISTGVHLILGIPGEDMSDIIATVSYINSNPIISEVKLHNLVVYQGTRLAECAPKKLVDIPDFNQYIEILGAVIAGLRKDIAIGRLFTSNVRAKQIALNPFQFAALGDKRQVTGGVKRDWMNILSSYLNENDITQGEHSGYNDKDCLAG